MTCEGRKRLWAAHTPLDRWGRSQSSFCQRAHPQGVWLSASCPGASRHGLSDCQGLALMGALMSQFAGLTKLHARIF